MLLLMCYYMHEHASTILMFYLVKVELQYI